MAWPIIAAMAAGAATNLISSGIQSHYADKANERELEARKEAAEQLRQQGQISDAEYKAVINQINQYYANRGSLGTASDVNKYKAAIEGYNPEDYAAEVGDFQYDKTKEDFINPYYSRIIGDTANQIQHSAAGAGLGRGTGAALNIAKGVSEKSDDLYRTAMSDYTQDKQFAYTQYQDALRNAQNRLNAIRQGTEYKMGLQRNLAQDYFANQDAQMSDVMKAQQDRLNAQTQYSMGMAGLY
jgi:hypothetical protein